MTVTEEQLNLKINDLLSTLAIVIARGLGVAQRRRVLADAPESFVRIDTANESQVYQRLKNNYAESQVYTATLIERVCRQQFIDDVTKELAEINSFVREGGLEVLHRGTAGKPRVYVVLPAQSRFLGIFERAIRPALQDLGCAVEHSTDALFAKATIKDIHLRADQAAFWVADVTGRSPAVANEVNYAQAQGKTVILLAQDTSDDVLVDPNRERYILYKERDYHALVRDLREAATRVLSELGLRPADLH